MRRLLALVLASVSCLASARFGGEIQRFSVTESAQPQVITLAADVSVGNTLVLMEAWSSSSQRMASVSDSRGNTWNLTVSRVCNTTHNIAMAHAYVTHALVAGDTISVTWTSPAYTYRWGMLSYLAGSDGTVDVTANGNSYATSVHVTNTTTVANTLLIGCVQPWGSTTWSGSSWTQIGAMHPYGTPLNNYYVYTEAATAGAYDPLGTLSTTDTWQGIWAAFKSATTADYYIDYDSGSDSNAGTQASPWKHCPGDSNATGTAAAHTPIAGDTFHFKAGVSYIGKVTISHSGGTGNPITYSGNTWGDGTATMDGTVPITTTWTNVTSSSEVNGNTGYSSIWRTTAPAGADVFTSLICTNTWLPFSQSTNQSGVASFAFDLTKWHTITPSGITSTSITDASVLTQATNYWDGCYVYIWCIPNSLKVVPITSYDPTTHTIGFDLGSSVYADRNSYYLLINNTGTIDSPGEYAYKNGVLYLRALDSGNPNSEQIRISSYDHGFKGTSASNIVVSGFTIQGYYGADGGFWSGDAINFNGTGGASENVTISNVKARLLRSMELTPSIVLSHCTNGVISSCVSSNNFDSRGFYSSSSSNVVVRQCLVDTVGGSGIYFAGVLGGTIQSNTINNIKGVHANGITVYQNSSDVVVRENKVSNCLFMVAFQEYTNVAFYNNLFDCSGIDSKVNEWGHSGNGYCRFINNTIVNHPTHYSLGIGTSAGNAVAYYLRNNIIDGGGPLEDLGLTVDRDYNLFIGKSAYNGPSDGWYLATHDTYNTNTAAIFAGWSAGDYSLASSSPAIDAGQSMSAYISTDILGQSRPNGSGFDVGAYEFFVSPVPAISSQPVSLYRQIGTSATFSITATGTAPLSYQWLKGASAITGATNSTYTISSCVLGDAGSYSCTVTNAYGSATSSAAVLSVFNLVPRGWIKN